MWGVRALRKPSVHRQWAETTTYMTLSPRAQGRSDPESACGETACPDSGQWDADGRDALPPLNLELKPSFHVFSSAPTPQTSSLSVLEAEASPGGRSLNPQVTTWSRASWPMLDCDVSKK